MRQEKGAGIGLILIVAAIWALGKKRAEAVSAPAHTLPEPTTKLTIADYQAGLEEAGYTEVVVTAAVTAKEKAEAEIARIEAQSPAVTQMEAEAGQTIAKNSIPPVIEGYPMSERAVESGAEAHLTPSGEIVISYPLKAENLVPNDIYGNPVTTKAEALEAAERQLRIASRNPNNPNMMAIAEAWFAYAASMDEAVTIAPVIPKTYTPPLPEPKPEPAPTPSPEPERERASEPAPEPEPVKVESEPKYEILLPSGDTGSFTEAQIRYMQD